MNGSSYLHVMEGRLRVKVPEMKRSVSKATHVEDLIRLLKGVEQVKANPTTGNVLVFFNSEHLTHVDILSTLKEAGYLQATDSAPSFQFTPSMVDTVFHAVARSVAETLTERAIMALL